MKKLITICLVLMFVLCATANATILGTVNTQNHNNNSLADTGTVYGDGHPGPSGISCYTGVYSWTNAGGTGLGTVVPNWGFCIELPQTPFTGWVNVIPLDESPLPAQYTTPMGITKANYIRELWGRDFSLIGNDSKKAEAFGVAIWEIIYETTTFPWDVTKGDFTANTSNVEDWALANTWLSELSGDFSKFAPNLVAISTVDGQDYVVQVPEPATIAILGLGALSLIRRKRIA